MAPAVRRSTALALVRLPCAIATDRKSTRLNSSHTVISYAVFCLKKKKNNYTPMARHQLDSGRTSTVTQARLAFQQDTQDDSVRTADEAAVQKTRAFTPQVYIAAT